MISLPRPFQVNCLNVMTMMNIRNKKAKWKREKKSADPDLLIPFPILKTAYESLGSFFVGRRNQ